MLDPAMVREKVRELKARDRTFRVFGSGFHGYRLNRPLSEAQVAAFEGQCRVRLPADYRLFLTEVGNGGAGPFYGVDRLGELEGRPWQGNMAVGDLSAPFPHREAWNLPASFWDQKPNGDIQRPEEEEYTLSEEWEARLNREYWAPAIMNGAIPICHLGCAQWHWLVVTGERSDEVWADDRVDERGIWPLRGRDGRPLTFASWYTGWLDHALFSLGCDPDSVAGPRTSFWARVLDRLRVDA